VIRALAIARALIIVALLAAPGCAAVKSAIGTCAGAVESTVKVLEDEAIASATGAPGAPSWTTWAATTLLSQGKGVTICVAQQAIAYIDSVLSPSTPAKAGHIALTNLSTNATPDQEVLPRDAVAHERLADLLDKLGAPHDHGASR
jgi:hypothetical protein